MSSSTPVEGSPVLALEN
jgi:hypothetical protein